MFFLYLILLTTIFLWFFIQTDANRFIKFISIIFLLHGYLTVVGTFEEISGYPTTENLPERSEIKWGEAVEPNTATGYKGHIDIWVVHRSSMVESFLSYFSLADNGAVSRIYRIPYTKENHKALKGIKDRIKKGKHTGVAVDKRNPTNVNLAEAMQKYAITYDSVMMKK
jgi:hypothetical protein